MHVSHAENTRRNANSYKASSLVSFHSLRMAIPPETRETSPALTIPSADCACLESTRSSGGIRLAIYGQNASAKRLLNRILLGPMLSVCLAQAAINVLYLGDNSMAGSLDSVIL